MFTAVINDTKNWKNSIDAIASIIDEGTFRIDEEGLHLRAMDPSQIALVDFEMPSSAFEEYKVDKQVDVGIDFTDLNRIMKRLKPEDKLHLSLDKQLSMKLKGETTRTFKTSIIDAQSTPPKEPQIDFTAEVKVSPSMVKEALKDAELVSNHVSISINDGFNITCDGDTGSAEINLPEDKLLALEKKEDAKAVFSLDHLANILNAAESPSIVSIKLRSDSPIKIEYAIGDGRVIYYLAPRIESM
jgi:proliferating cell nuclear antigen